MMALALAPLSDSVISYHEVFTTHGKRPDSLVGVVVIHGNVTIIQEFPEVFLLIDAVG